MAYNFRKTFFIGQNLKQIHMAYCFIELLILFWLTLVNIYCLDFNSHYINKILYVNQNSKGKQSWNKTKRYTFWLVFDIDVKKSCLCQCRIKIPYQLFLIFLSFMNKFSEVAVQIFKEISCSSQHVLETSFNV